MEELKEQGHKEVFVLIPTTDKKLIKFEKMFGFTPVKELNGVLLMAVLRRINMGMDPITLAYLAIGTQAVGTIASAQQQRKAGQAAQRQYEAEGRKAEVQNIRSVRQQIREARLAQASMLNVGAQTGAMGGSGLAGGISSVGSQLSSNVNYMQQIAQQNTAIGAAAAAGAQATSNAAIYGSIGQLGGTIFSAMNGPKVLATAKAPAVDPLANWRRYGSGGD